MGWFAQSSKDAANEWLARNPLVLGGGAALLGLALIGFGVAALVQGRTRSKFGVQFEGGGANILGIVRIVGGVGCLLFGVYKIVMGLLG